MIGHNEEKKQANLFSKRNIIIMNSPPFSCGFTMSCMLGLFLNHTQYASRSTVGYILDGPPIFQLVSNPNILLCSLRQLIAPVVCNEVRYDAMARAISKRASIKACAALKFDLLQADVSNYLPRVFFCSITWIIASGISSIDIMDHKFTLIKHSNERFQILQGYVNTPEVTSGFGLTDWYKMKHISHSNPAGFNLAVMETVFTKLEHFASDELFDAQIYEELFGVHIKGGDGMSYWPSFYHRELLDDNIIGCGERDLADNLELYMDEKKFT